MRFFNWPRRALTKTWRCLADVVFGVFAEVAEGYGFFDFGGEFGGEFVFELFDLFEEFLFDVFGHGGFLGSMLDGVLA